MPQFIFRTYSSIYFININVTFRDHAIGFVLIQQFVISFGFLLPVSAPQNMLAYGTGTFTVKIS